MLRKLEFDIACVAGSLALGYREIINEKLKIKNAPQMLRKIRNKK